MSQLDDKESILSEDAAEHSDINTLKLVPVAESIRYRKRAQSAEKKNEVLAEQLTGAESRISEMAEQLSNIQIEQKLMRKLSAAGTVDLETAVLIGKAKIDGQKDADMDSVVEQLRKEKQYLFSGNGNARIVSAKKTSGAKDRIQNNRTILAKAAKKAATTGKRTDLQEYLKLRRNFV